VQSRRADRPWPLAGHRPHPRPLRSKRSANYFVAAGYEYSLIGTRSSGRARQWIKVFVIDRTGRAEVTRVRCDALRQLRPSRPKSMATNSATSRAARRGVRAADIGAKTQTAPRVRRHLAPTIPLRDTDLPTLAGRLLVLLVSRSWCVPTSP